MLLELFGLIIMALPFFFIVKQVSKDNSNPDHTPDPDTNKTFLVIVTIMGLMLIVALVFFGIWALVINPKQQAQWLQDATAIAQANDLLTPTLTARSSDCPTLTVLECPNCDYLQPGYALLSETCTSDECILLREEEPDYPIGVAALQGYYTPRVRTEAFSESGTETVTCNSFVITGGSEVLMRAYLSLVEKGNSINARNELNQPVINLDFGALTEEEVTHILASTATEPLTLIVVSRSPIYESVPACFSPVEVLRVK